MKKLKIIGINNNEDSIWFKVEGTIQSVDYLNKIFDINHILYEPNEQKPTYKKIVSFGDVSFFRENSIFLSYFIFTPKIIHIILRKTKDYKIIKKKILDVFEFKKKS